MTTNNQTKVERISDLEIVATHSVNAPAHLVWQAWTNADLFRRWWVPKAFAELLLSCDMDVREGGQYRLVFRHEDSEMAFFGTYLEAVPCSRLVWTNDEGDAGQQITTVTFEETDGKTVVVMHDRYPTTEAIDSGATGALPEAMAQLDELMTEMQNN